MANTWKTCKTHGPDKPGVWGCPECLRELREENKRLRTAMQDIADHHEDQRECWSSEWNADADQARYHEERRNLALWHLMTPNA